RLQALDLALERLDALHAAPLPRRRLGRVAVARARGAAPLLLEQRQVDGHRRERVLDLVRQARGHAREQAVAVLLASRAGARRERLGPQRGLEAALLRRGGLLAGR